MSNQDQQRRERIEQQVREAKHLSKPHADGVVVIRDASGRWLFEIYPGKPEAKR